MEYYSQMNGHWKSTKLGNGKETIAQVGCLLTCLSMLLQIDPSKLNTIIKAGGGFTGATKTL